MPKSFKKPVRKVGFVVKFHQPEAASLAVTLGEYLHERRIKVYFCTESDTVARELKNRVASRKSDIHIIPKEKMPLHVDLVVVLGGDGTYLSIARKMHRRSVPVMGVNMGQLGFLTEIKKEEAHDILDRIITHREAIISERPLLEVELIRKTKTIFRGPVVNDAVISKGAIARIIGMQVALNGQVVNDVRADGLIVSTPTGSTAYALAAGGPITDPSVPALVIAPICPHGLTQRPLVVSDKYEVEIRLTSRPGHVLLTLDGQDAVDMSEADRVLIRRFGKHSLQLISSPTRDYFSLLKEKFQFGQRG